MAPVTESIEVPVRSHGQVKIGFRSGWLRVVAIQLGGAGLIGLAFAVLSLAQRQPVQMFDLLRGWGFAWLLILVALFIAWDLAKLGLGYLGKLADSVQAMGMAMNRIADKDDRERDRMVTETAFVGQRLQRMAEQHEEWKTEQRQHNVKLESLLEQLISKNKA